MIIRSRNFQIMFTMYMATQSITFCVPHVEGFAAARGAAASIFSMIEREPGIDSLQEGGSSPRRVIGDIKMEDVHFSYPSRPNVKVGTLLKKKKRLGSDYRSSGPWGTSAISF